MPTFTAQRSEEMRKIREAIARASSLEEVERLNQLLQSGQIPGKTNDASSISGEFYAILDNSVFISFLKLICNLYYS